MISPKTRDMNRSRDVPGPKLQRSYDQENAMDKSMSSLFHDDHPTGMISKHPLHELHMGDVEAPLVATGEQEVVKKVPMGEDHPDWVPQTAKGSGGGKEDMYSKSAPHQSGVRQSMPKGMGRSVAKEMQYSQKRKAVEPHDSGY